MSEIHDIMVSVMKKANFKLVTISYQTQDL